MLHSKYTAIVFDFDGTLVDSNEVKERAFGELYLPYGDELSNQVMEYHRKHRGISRFQKFRYFQESLLGKTYSEDDGQKLSKRFSALVLQKVLEAPFFEGVEAFLDKYFRFIPLFLASATPESELREIVLRRNIHQYFKGVYGSPKTKREILQNIIRDYDLNPQTVLMIGDAPSDFEGARLAGTPFLGIQSSGEEDFPPGVCLVKQFKEVERQIVA